ncbi:SPOR domain-containing protein [Tepidimonas ignava]|uniref:SPOR domain-containing protein n=1 Tax=Tepidimonas ignava TaxID=114249 RepID=UPI002FDB5970
MLRVLVLLLLLANAALAAWQWGWLGAPPPAPAQAASEPQRLAQQIEPERLRLLNPPGQAGHATEPTPPLQQEAPPPVPTTQPTDTPTPPGAVAREARRCWQLPPLPLEQAQALRRSAETQADLRGRHTETPGTLPVRWLVYIGPLAEADLAARRAALRLQGLDHRTVEVPGTGSGLALGTFSTEDAARRALAEVQQRGVRDARVVRERPPVNVLTLRWPDLTDAELARLRTALGTQARSLAACPATGG